MVSLSAGFEPSSRRTYVCHVQPTKAAGASQADRRVRDGFCVSPARLEIPVQQNDTMLTMDDQPRITTDPHVLGGKPAVRGTRLGVAFLRGLVAQGWSDDELLDSYPRLTPEALFAVKQISDSELTRIHAQAPH